MFYFLTWGNLLPSVTPHKSSTAPSAFMGAVAQLWERQLQQNCPRKDAPTKNQLGKQSCVTYSAQCSLGTSRTHPRSPPPQLDGKGDFWGGDTVVLLRMEGKTYLTAPSTKSGSLFPASPHWVHLCSLPPLLRMEGKTYLTAPSTKSGSLFPASPHWIHLCSLLPLASITIGSTACAVRSSRKLGEKALARGCRGGKR